MTGCQVGGHLEKGGKRGHFTGKGGQKEDILLEKEDKKRTFFL